MPTNTYQVEITTGDVKGGGTKGAVYIQLIGKNGVKSEMTHLNNFWHTNLSRDSISKHDVEATGIDSVHAILFHRPGKPDDHHWFVQHVCVCGTSDRHFPLSRWITSGSESLFFCLDSFLPQNCPNLEQRKAELAKKAVTYKFSTEWDGYPRTTATLPREEVFSSDYGLNIITTTLAGKFNSALQKLFRGNSFDSFDDIYKLYEQPTYCVPEGQNDWRTDEKFAALRLIGPNCVIIELCKQIPTNFPVEEEKIQILLEGKTLETALNEEKIFICNYKMLENLKFKRNGKQMVCPLGLFYSRDDGVLIPLAIQLYQVPSETNPIFYPPPTDDERVWLQARFWFNVADTNHHEAITHLLCTHLVAGDVVTCFHQTVSPSHPIYKLMMPHFIFLLSINITGMPQLLDKGAMMDQVLEIGADGGRQIMLQEYAKWRMDTNGWYPADIENRGVKNLKNYHFREDADLLFEAIHDYVGKVVKLTYSDNLEELKKDDEIQAFAKLLSDPNGGMKGVFGNGVFHNFEDLVKTLTSFIMIVTCMHAAANFNQYEEYAFPPNYSSILNGDPPTNKDKVTEEDLVKLFTVDNTLNVMAVGKQLSLQGTNKIGIYEIKYQYTEHADEEYKKFVKRMNEIQREIDERNMMRRFKYKYLSPEFVPNSISI